MSGEALSRNHCCRSALTAIDDWERELQGRDPVRAARHGGHVQFHCGNPPPAADPSTRTHKPITPFAVSPTGRRADSAQRPIVID
nr:hypothetical protein GCM10017611_06010 [Rhodococcus wratislaviensis]